MALLSEELWRRRFGADLGVILSVVGVYGMLAFAVTRRTHELGIRMALGAARRTVVLSILRQALGRIGAGLVAGGLLAAAGGRLLRGLLYQVSPTDPVTFAGAAPKTGAS